MRVSKDRSRLPPNENVWASPPISDPIDFRLHLSNVEFRSRVLQSKAWAEYLKLPPIAPFDEAGARSEIAERNEIRLANKLPGLNVEHEVARWREHYESETHSNRLHSLASAVIEEIYGQITPNDFKSLSGLRGFVVEKRNLIEALVSMHNRNQTE